MKRWGEQDFHLAALKNRKGSCSSTEREIGKVTRVSMTVPLSHCFSQTQRCLGTRQNSEWPGYKRNLRKDPVLRKPGV